MCLYPRIMINKKYTPNKKNNGNVPNIKDERTRYVPIGCGRCIECLKQKSRGWAIRMQEELRSNNVAVFVTLTFSDESIIKLSKKYDIKDGFQSNELATKSIRLFLENVRKSTKKSVKHWLVTELGHKNTERIHLHGIIWTSEELIRKHWKYGYIYIGDYVNNKTINYIIKYITKIDKDHTWFKPKILCSPGLGKNYINTHNAKNKLYKGEKTDESYNYSNGNKSSLPTYYRNKLYSPDEREYLWINRLNKEERYVGGEKVDVSTKEGLENYKKLRDWYRKKNKKMGYGSIDVPEEIYHKKIQEIKKITTIAKESHTHKLPSAEDITPNNNDLLPNEQF